MHAKCTAVGVLAVGGAGVLFHYALRYRRRQHLTQKRQQKQTETRANIEAVREKLNQTKINADRLEEITSLPTAELLAGLKDGSLKPTDVLMAFQWKALEAHEKTNCLVQFIDEAETWAAALENGPKEGELYGLPVAIMDDMAIQGYDSLLGCSKRVGHPYAEDSVTVSVLKQHGAIPFVKTNTPQALFSVETSNPMFGTTINCRDKTRTAGGSSGGNGALIGCGGAALAFASDLAGSIRIPAHMNGIYGFKQSAGRSSDINCFSPVKGSLLVGFTYGPMARDVDGLVAGFKALVTPAMFNQDVRVPPMLFDDKEFKDSRRLRIGYFSHIGAFRAMPPCERAVMVAKEALEKAGHTVVPFEPPRIAVAKLTQAMLYTIYADGAQTLVDLVKDDAVDLKALGSQIYSLTMPRWLRWPLSILVKPFNPQLAWRLQIEFPTKEVRLTGNYCKAAIETEEVKHNFFREWRKQGLDAVICPAYGLVPLPLNNVETLKAGLMYTGLFNALDYPAGVLPITSINEEDLENLKQYPEDTHYHKIAKQGMAGIGPLPVGVQVSTLTWKDELCLRIMKELEDIVQYKPSE